MKIHRLVIGIALSTLFMFGPVQSEVQNPIPDAEFKWKVEDVGADTIAICNISKLVEAAQFFAYTVHPYYLGAAAALKDKGDKREDGTFLVPTSQLESYNAARHEALKALGKCEAFIEAQERMNAGAGIEK